MKHVKLFEQFITEKKAPQTFILSETPLSDDVVINLIDLRKLASGTYRSTAIIKFANTADLNLYLNDKKSAREIIHRGLVNLAGDRGWDLPNVNYSVQFNDFDVSGNSITGQLEFVPN
jgi:hypothetical protein